MIEAKFQWFLGGTLNASGKNSVNIKSLKKEMRIQLKTPVVRQIKVKNFMDFGFGLMASCQKVPKFDFQSQFSMSKIVRIFLNFFH